MAATHEPRAAATTTTTMARMPPDADTQQQLLALAAVTGCATQLYARFTPLVVDLLARASSSSSKSVNGMSTTATPDEHLLQAAFGARLENRVKAGLCAPPMSQATKRGKASVANSAAAGVDVQRQSVAFAAKLAQSVVKAYAAAAVAQGTTDADVKSNQDVFVAMDIAAAALFVVLKFERALKLSDLVVDNLLYQVAKKYAELPQGRSAACFTLACLHARLWRTHGALCASLRESPPLHRDCLALTLAPESKLSPATIRHLAELPPPHASASASFARLLIGVANACVTVLVHAKQHQMVAAVAVSTLRPWITHLATIPGANTKLAGSFSDRIFRVLWKSASTLDASATPDRALRVRSLALTFMLQCPTYTTLYLVQQTYRVGVQFERTSKRTRTDYRALHMFYMSVIDLLRQRSATLSVIFESECLEWNYVLWLEHVASVCESAGHTRDAVLVLDCAVRYLHSLPASEDAVSMLFHHAMASQLLDHASGNDEAPDSAVAADSVEQCVRGALLQLADPVVRAAVVQHSESPVSSARSSDRAAAQYLREVVTTDTQGFVASCAHKNFAPFALRCAKKAVTRLYNYVVTSKIAASVELRDLILASCDKVASGIEVIRTKHAFTAGDATTQEAVALTESRICRMVVTLAVHCERHDSEHDDTASDARLALLTKHVALVRRLLDDAMADDASASSDQVLQALLADINAIARECYSCAARAYKRQMDATTLAALTAAFELAESYIEYVMCSATITATAIQHTHAELKVDAIASLMAFCFHAHGDLRRSRTSAGHALMYACDAHARVPVKAVEKFVAAVFEELQAGVSARALGDDVQALVVNVMHAFAARGVAERLVHRLVHCFRRVFDLTASRLVETVRTRRAGADGSVETNAIAVRCALEGLQLWANSERCLLELLFKRGESSQRPAEHTALLSVSRALVERKLGFAAYYESLDARAVIRALTQARSLLSDAIAGLAASLDKIHIVDLGCACGWRGVITMEIVLLGSYSAAADDSADKRERVADVSEENAMRDIEACVRHLESVSAADASNADALFDVHGVNQCLAAVCAALSLISCPFLETSAQTLLTKFQSSGVGDDPNSAPLSTWPRPSLELLNLHVDGAASVCTQSRTNGPLLQLQQIDAEIALGVKYHATTDAASTVRHLRRAMELLRELKERGVSTSGSRANALKAMGMRELLLRLLLSEVHFAQGRARTAVAEAKAALSICWKLARKFASPALLVDAARFVLPEELTRPSGSGGGARLDGTRSASLAYFQALEFSSWDVLHAAKLVLCRIGTLCSLSGQPHRAQVYFTEAMELVGGLDLRFFQRSPFYEFARLQLDASRPDQASAALRVMGSHNDRWHADGRCRRDEVAGCHSCFATDAAFIEQACNEVIQRGDLALAQRDASTAIETYARALEMLKTVFKRPQQPTISTGLRTTRARCLRKILRLKATHADLSDAAVVDKLLTIRKQLHTCLTSLEDRIERVECLHELGFVDLLLLASPSSSSRTLVDCDETMRILEEAYALGDHLALPHVSKQLRSSLGSAYVVALERRMIRANNGGDGTSAASRDEFLAWASAIHLANSSVVEQSEDASAHDDARDLELDKCLEQLSSRLSLEPPAPSELVISRISNDGESPVSFCLRDTRWQSTMDEVEAVIRKSRESLAGNSADSTATWSTEQKKQWWDTRKQLDERLEAAVRCFQSTLGFWRCLLVRAEAVDETQVQRCWRLLTAHASAPPRALETRLQALLFSLIGSQTLLLDSEFAAGLHHIAGELDVVLSEGDVDRMCAIARADASEHQDDRRDQGAGESADGFTLGAFTPEEIGKMRVSELKNRLADAGLSTDGLKKVLVDRLIEARDSALALRLPSPLAKSSGGCVDSSTGNATILVLDQRLQELPWEAFDVLHTRGSVTRMPSLERTLRTASVLAARRNAGLSSSNSGAALIPSIRRERVRFVLNAAGDLTSTQRQLAPILERGRDALGWRGIVGRVPEEAEMREFLTTSDLFIYCGHGSGEKYLHRSKILELERGCSAALLFGCSSGRLEREGIFGPDGAVLAYLRAGSPAVLAMLWDVTDRDIDQLSVEVLRKWLLRDSDVDVDCEPLARALHRAREVCKLKFLNGHAAVCYGLPLFVS